MPSKLHCDRCDMVDSPKNPVSQIKLTLKSQNNNLVDLEGSKDLCLTCQKFFETAVRTVFNELIDRSPTSPSLIPERTFARPTPETNGKAAAIVGDDDIPTPEEAKLAAAELKEEKPKAKLKNVK